jgi:hypothetical protein
VLTIAIARPSFCIPQTRCEPCTVGDGAGDGDGDNAGCARSPTASAHCLTARTCCCILACDPVAATLKPVLRWRWRSSRVQHLKLRVPGPGTPIRRICEEAPLARDRSPFAQPRLATVIVRSPLVRFSRQEMRWGSPAELSLHPVSGRFVFLFLSSSPLIQVFTVSFPHSNFSTFARSLFHARIAVLRSVTHYHPTHP